MVCAAPWLVATQFGLTIERSSIAVLAASGGLEGGEGIPELTSGTPLCPACTGSGVMEAFQGLGLGIDGIAAGSNVGARLCCIAIIGTFRTAGFRHYRGVCLR